MGKNISPKVTMRPVKKAPLLKTIFWFLGKKWKTPLRNKRGNGRNQCPQNLISP